MIFRGKFPQEIEDIIFDYTGPYTKYLNDKLRVDKNELSVKQIHEILYDILTNDMYKCLISYNKIRNKRKRLYMTCFTIIDGIPNKYDDCCIINHELYKLFIKHFSSIILKKSVNYFAIKNVKNVVICVKRNIISKPFIDYNSILNYVQFSPLENFLAGL